jgi:hypothetical protein
LFGFLVLFDGIDFIICYGLGHHGHSHIFALNGLMIGWTLLLGNLLLVCARFDILTVVLLRIQSSGMYVVSIEQVVPNISNESSAF